MKSELEKCLEYLNQKRSAWSQIKPFGKRMIIEGVNCIVHVPENKKDDCPLFLFMHGGAFIDGDAALVDSLCDIVSKEAGCIAVNVNYVKCDVKPLPYADREVIRVIKHFAGNSSFYGIDPGKIVIAGTSAGGHIAAGAAILAKRKNVPLARQILIYPATDFSGILSNPLSECGMHSIAWKTWEGIIFRGLPLDDSLISPAASPIDELSGLAPADVIVCKNDSLREHGVYYASRLKEAGVEVAFKEYETGVHGFLEVNRPDYPGYDPSVDPRQTAECRDCERYIISIINSL